MKNIILVICSISVLILFSFLYFELKQEKEQSLKNISKLTKEYERKLVIEREKRFNMTTSEYMEIFIKKQNPKISDSEIKRIINTVNSESHKYNMHPLIYIAFMDIESDFRKKATNLNGKVIGIMQIHIIWKNELIENGIINNVDELYSIEKNIKAGAYIIDKYYNLCYNKNTNLETSWTCVSKRYFGGGNYEAYYSRLKNSIGHYYLNTIDVNIDKNQI